MPPRTSMPSIRSDKLGALAPSESGSILAISVDGKGVVLRGEDLREATRQRAEASEHKLQKRLSKGEKRHAKRMATVAAVYTIAPQVRRPEEVMRVLAPQPQREEGKRPRPQHKRLWASLEKRPEEVIEQALGEARSRDPTGRKSWVVLVDGHRSQLKTLLRCLRRSGVGAPTIVLDFIHVSEYVWKAGMALHGEVHPKLEGWVSEHLLSILRGRSGYVAGGIRRSATRRGLEGKAREAVDRCANYFGRAFCPSCGEYNRTSPHFSVRIVASLVPRSYRLQVMHIRLGFQDLLDVCLSNMTTHIVSFVAIIVAIRIGKGFSISLEKSPRNRSEEIESDSLLKKAYHASSIGTHPSEAIFFHGNLHRLNRISSSTEALSLVKIFNRSEANMGR